MLGKDKESSEVLGNVDSLQLPHSMKQGLLLSLALARQRMGDSEGAVEFASKILKEERKTSTGLQARAILMEENPNTTDEQFRKLERTCRKSAASVVANNLTLSRVERAATGQGEAEKALDEVINTTDKSDFYNRVRAIIKKTKIKNKDKADMSDHDKSLLIDAYHFLYNERMPQLFDNCHAALWDLFVRDGDQENLLRLFRHSSLIWRLRGEDTKERDYLKRLAKNVHSLLTRDIRLVDKETAYYLVRMSDVFD